MIYVILGFFSLSIALFVFLSSKYRNPFKLIFIFGKKGSGKSCLMVKKLLEYKRKGWTCYTDMPVKINGVRIINASDLKDHWPDEKSALFLDEVGLTWDNRGFKTFDKGFTEFFKLQRKCKCVVYMNSQSFDIDKKIRDVTDSMILQTNIGNVISVSRPILRKVKLVEASADSESRIADDLMFDKFWHYKFYYMPKYFKYFYSFDKPERPPLPYDTTEVVEDPHSKRVFFRRKKARPADSGSVQPLDTDCLTTTKQSVTEDERQLTDFTPILYNS